MDVISYVKQNFGSVLPGATTFLYVSGYLTLRARAFTLGIDPPFALAYEGYIFAGFRFIFICLIILLFLGFVFAFIRYLYQYLYQKKYIKKCVDNIKQLNKVCLLCCQYILLFFLGIFTLYIIAGVVSQNGILLSVQNNEVNFMRRAVMEGGIYAIAIFFILLALISCSIFWLKTRLAKPNDPFTWILGIVTAIQAVLLPLAHGALYADRKVRVLAEVPSAAKGLELPIGIVDRTGSHVALLGLDKNSEQRLMTVKFDDLNGIPIQRIASLKEFVSNDLAYAKEKWKSKTIAHQETEMNKPVQDASKTDNSFFKHGFFKQLIAQLHMTFENIGSLGDSVVEYGQIWSVELDALGRPSEPMKISEENKLSWPVLSPDGQTVYALQENRIVQLGSDGKSIKNVEQEKQWMKLLGVTKQDNILGIIDDNDESRIAVLHADGAITIPPVQQSVEEQKWLSLLEQENRSYADNKSLYIERSERGGRGFDVFFKIGEEIHNLSDCGDDRCGQPSSSADFKKVFYVRKSRY